jgi:thioredoxin 1
MKKAIRFTASWCLPCRTYAKYWDKVSETRSDWEFQVIDVDVDPETAEKYNIRSIPTTVLIKDEEVVAKHVSVMMDKEINEKLDHWS